MTSTDFVLSEAMRPRLATGVDYHVLVKDSLNYEDAANDHRIGYGPCLFQARVRNRNASTFVIPCGVELFPRIANRGD